MKLIPIVNVCGSLVLIRLMAPSQPYRTMTNINTFKAYGKTNPFDPYPPIHLQSGK
jgi:hypothetical protein